MWPERIRRPLHRIQSDARSPFSRPKLLEPALKWCLSGPGPPLSSERLQAAPAAAAGLHPGAGPAVPAAARRRWRRPARALRLLRGRLQPGSSAPRPHLPAPRVPWRPQRQQRQPLGSSQARSGCAAAKKASSYWPERGPPPSAKTPPIGPSGAAAAAPHAGRVDYPAARRSANRSAGAARVGGGGLARDAGWRARARAS